MIAAREMAHASRPTLTEHIVRVAEPAAVAAFYKRHFGLVEVAAPTPGCIRLRGTADAVTVELQQATGSARAALNDGDVFWKLGTSWPDVRAKREALIAAGVAVTEPRQFRDIGFLCHLVDPEGFGLELLQHTFEPALSAPTPDAQPTAPLHITLRVADADASLAFYRERLHMRLLSRQRVDPYGFTLYFLASTEERPPSSDLDAVSNREWLWQRPYTCLELKHSDTSSQPGAAYHEAGHGPWGLGFTVRGAETARTVVVTDPDGYAARIRYEV